MTTKQWIYRRQPTGQITTDHYELVEQALDTTLADGEVLIASRYFSVDPYMRIGQSSKPTYDADPHPLNTVQQGGVVAQVLASNAPGFAEGDWVQSYTGWQTHARVHASALKRIDPDLAPVTTALGVLGMPGRTAWFGLTESGKPHAVKWWWCPARPVRWVRWWCSSPSATARACWASPAARPSATGCATRWALTGPSTTKPFDADALGAEIKRLTGGVDVYFDNVGGMVTDAIIPLINRRARIVICGQISQYSGGLETPELGPRLLHHMLYQRATIQGMLARDYLHRMDEMIRIVGPWVKAARSCLKKP
jgi:NADPH-dependent curcumin reductase CurA